MIQALWFLAGAAVATLVMAIVNVIFVLKDGTLYPILYRLEDEGMVVSKWSEAVGKQVPRKYYEITETGKSALKSIEEIWKSISRGIIKIMEE